jgi:hypothetical protein
MPVEDPFKNIVTFVEIGRGFLTRAVLKTAVRWLRRTGCQSIRLAWRTFMPSTSCNAFDRGLRADRAARSELDLSSLLALSPFLKAEFPF